jgi:sugar phosphate isomerase/epimerase
VVKLSLITDEVSQDLDTALDFGLDHGVRWFALRSLWGKNLLQLDDAEVDAVLAGIGKRSVHVSALMSPLFKCYLSGDGASPDPSRYFVGFSRSLADHVASVPRLSWLATRLDARLVRVFSFLKQPGMPLQRAQPAISTWLARSLQLPATVCLENEHTCYIDTLPAQLAFLAANAGALERLRAAVDPCNHLRIAQTDGLEELRGSPLLQRTVDVHVKDLDDQGRFVPVGMGTVRWPELVDELRRCRYDGFVTLEAHLPGDLAAVEESLRTVITWLE